MAAANDNNQTLWNKLADAGLVQGTPPAIETSDSPWYINMLLALSGWMAALFLLGFIAVGFVYILENRLAAFTAGGLMIAVAFSILRLPKNEFIQHLMLATSLTGQALMVFAIFADTSKDNLAYGWAMITLMQLLLALFMADFLHRVWSAFAAAIAFSVTLQLFHLPAIESAALLLLCTYLLLNEFRYPTQIRKFQALAYGLILALLLLNSTALFRSYPLDWITGSSPTISYPWLDELLLGGAMLYLVFNLLRRYQQPRFTFLTVAAIASALLLCALSLEVQGITVAIAIMLLGFAVSNRVLLSLGIAALLFYSSSYYYQLHATLLEKSQTLLILAVALLALRYLLVRFTADKKDIAHDS